MCICTSYMISFYFWWRCQFQWGTTSIFDILDFMGTPGTFRSVWTRSFYMVWTFDKIWHRFISHDGSVCMPYMDPHLPSIYPSFVSINILYMDPSWVLATFFWDIWLGTISIFRHWSNHKIREVCDHFPQKGHGNGFNDWIWKDVQICKATCRRADFSYERNGGMKPLVIFGHLWSSVDSSSIWLGKLRCFSNWKWVIFKGRFAFIDIISWWAGCEVDFIYTTAQIKKKILSSPWGWKSSFQ